MAATHGNFADIVALAEPALRPICESLRRSILRLHKSAFETAWPIQAIASYGVGPKKMTQHYVYIAVQPSHINLGFYDGASLHDPNQLLEGRGKSLRHIKLFDASSAEHPALIALLSQAISRKQDGMQINR
jgi:Domain of unknown function (DU1801)